MDIGLVQAELEPGILDVGMKAKGEPQIREIFYDGKPKGELMGSRKRRN